MQSTYVQIQVPRMYVQPLPMDFPSCLGVRRGAKLENIRVHGPVGRSTCLKGPMLAVWTSPNGQQVSVNIPLEVTGPDGLVPRVKVVHGTVQQKCARNTLSGRSGILYRPALGELRGRPLPTSSTRAPEATPN